MQLQKVWDLTYDEYVQILLKKYGPATSNYVENGKVVASKAWDRGLECHHIDEDKFPNLSDIKEAERHPEYQTADRLVYCNRLEHLILHAKIAKMTHNDYNLRGLIGYFKGGCQLLITRLNDAYTNPPTEFCWNSRVAYRIRDKESLYIQILLFIKDDRLELGYTEDEIHELFMSHTDEYPAAIEGLLDYVYRNKKIVI